MSAHEIVSHWLLVLAIDALRYALPATLAFTVFWVWGRDRFRARAIVIGRRRAGDLGASPIAHDLARSAATILTFSIVGIATWVAGHAGIVRRYEDVAEHGVAWLVSSVLVLIVLQDAYFYWTHRAMHHPRLYACFHRAHHEARLASPFTSYAFALPEALVHALFVPLVWLVIPLHELAVFAFLLFMIVRNVIGHLSIELMPSGFTRHPLFGWSTTTTHHALHHAHAGFDFGLYSTFWDRLMGTTHPRYHQTFEAVVRGDGSTLRSRREAVVS